MRHAWLTERIEALHAVFRSAYSAPVYPRWAHSRPQVPGGPV